ncbi:MAG: site-2 protease family protein [Methanothrix sp.]|jgi:Predicted membrane-associated Zn-dependent proteases 1|uniref:Peptidase M50 n=1 Tax=Methanothrix thermoacetophila (strain DSM 6194 / JCM 14653 / NBRC 101360 / PT) TaxID=349307 RepID=A0B5J7_METTP|nr:site-2 protease family protein [Methanothrix thermoacetophila]ABK13971.1 peptidase M50 [Methanothrix thermoacetophila PT]MBC7079852.1 site-2 protease family protein [Methanothrix sp.]
MDFSSEQWIILIVLALGLLSLLGTALGGGRGISSWGPVIFVRTTRGLGLLDRLAGARSLWRLTTTIFMPIVMAGMIYFLLLLLLMVYVMWRAPPEPGSYSAPRNVLLIPGVNQYIPLVWGWIALCVTIVVHELSHGILCRVEGIRVKSMGLIFLLFPIGAFVEPDDSELFGDEKNPPKATCQARIRILSAGVIANFLVAALALSLFFGPVISALSPVDRVVVVDVDPESRFAGDVRAGMVVSGASSLEELYRIASEGRSLELFDDTSRAIISGEPVLGVQVVDTFDGSPAKDAGMPERFVITDINDTRVDSLESFRDYMNSTYPGQILKINTTKGSYSVKLAPKGDGTGMIGVAISGTALYLDGVTFQELQPERFLALMRSIPSSGLKGFNTLMGLPFTGVVGFTSDGFQGFSGSMLYLFEPAGWAEPLGGKIFWIANLLLWIGWINMYAGLFNCLPTIPLDGGHIARDMIRMLLDKVMSERSAERFTRGIVAALSWLVISSLIFTVLGPYLAHGIPL